MKTKLSAITIAIAGAWTLAAVQTQAQESSPAAATKTETAATGAQRTDTEWDGVSVELTSVARGEGDTITIKFRYTNSGSKTADITTLGQFGIDNVAEHVYYVDPGNKKKYLVIKDAEGKGIASNMHYLKIEASASRAGWAKFPAPPPGVSKISVYLPGAPPFEGVTIASQ